MSNWLELRLLACVDLLADADHRGSGMSRTADLDERAHGQHMKVESDRLTAVGH